MCGTLVQYTTCTTVHSCSDTNVNLSVFSLAIHPFQLIFEFSVFKEIKLTLEYSRFIYLFCFTYSLKLFCPLLPLGFFSFLFHQTFLSMFYS